jgi:hypothetical protein
MASTQSKTEAAGDTITHLPLKTSVGQHVERLDSSGVHAVHLDELPPGYYKSWTYVGTFVAVCISSACAYASFGFPTNLLAIINEDLGKPSQYIAVYRDMTLSFFQDQVLIMCGFRWSGQ